MQVRERSLDDPALTAEPGAVIGAAAGDHRLDAASPELATLLVVVIAAIGEQPLGAFSGPPDLAAHRADPVDQREQLDDVVAVAAGQTDRQRDSARVGQQMVLGPGA